MKKLLFSILAIALLSIGLNACNQTKLVTEPEVEGSINTTATSDKLADLGNKIWIDANKDGIKQRPESGFAGIVVNLYKDVNKDGKADGDVFMTDTTNKGGYYRFNKLNPDINYLLEVVAPDGYKFSKKHNSNAKNKDYDSDFNSSGFSDSIDVKKGRYFYWFDAALQPIGTTNPNPARVGDKIWLDANKDGIKQRPESGLANISLNLWLDSNNDGKPDKKVSSTKTNSAGNYQFKDLNPSLSYYVQIELPTNYKVSKKHNSDAKGKDWDNDFNSNGYTDKLNLKAGKFNYWLADGAIYESDSNPSGCVDPVVIPDPYLKSALESKLSGKITCATLASLTEFKLNSSKATDLTGLEYAHNILFLELRGNLVSDYSPLSKLTKLQLLNLGGPNFSDISALASLVNLTQLRLYQNDISDISALSKLVKLKLLGISYNNISDISALGSLKNMLYLDLSNNKISDISILSNLTKLKKLSLSDNAITDISALSQLTNLGDLELTKNNISDIQALVDNNGIRGYSDHVDLRNNCLDIKSSPDIDNLNILLERKISLTYGGQRNCETPPPPPSECVDPVVIPDPVLKADLEERLGTITCKKLRSLKKLTGVLHTKPGEAKIKDLTGLEYAVNLEVIDLVHNEVSDISALAHMSKLRELDVSFNPVTDLSPLAGLEKLEGLAAAGGGYSKNLTIDLSPLSGLNLYWIKVTSTKVTGMSALSNMTNLEDINLSHNNITDISALSGLAKVNHISISLYDNFISDISALVANKDIASGDVLRVGRNCLDLSSGSDDLANVNILRNRGVTVYDEYQKDCN